MLRSSSTSSTRRLRIERSTETMIQPAGILSKARQIAKPTSFLNNWRRARPVRCAPISSLERAGRGDMRLGRLGPAAALVSLVLGHGVAQAQTGSIAGVARDT